MPGRSLSPQAAIHGSLSVCATVALYAVTLTSSQRRSFADTVLLARPNSTALTHEIDLSASCRCMRGSKIRALRVAESRLQARQEEQRPCHRALAAGIAPHARVWPAAGSLYTLPRPHGSEAIRAW
jgi:hypothetical protein